MCNDVMTNRASYGDDDGGPVRGLNRSSGDEKHNIYFLKMHKCSSSTVQNILMRFGLMNSLDFVLPPSGNYLGSPELFHPRLVPPDLTPIDGKFNILTHHSRWSRSGVGRAMYPGAVWITILRDPATLYESLFSYYAFSKFFNCTLEDIINDPYSHRKVFTYRYNNRVGVNQMCWDLGLKQGEFNDSRAVDRLIRSVDEAFDLVMITEFMEPSLVLLADKLNWPLERVASLKLNSRPNRQILTTNQTDFLLKMNSADAKLYGYFLDKFRRAVKSYGRERMISRVELLISLNQRLYVDCVQRSNHFGYGKTVSYNVSNTPRCKYAAIGELEFTDELRKLQKERLKKMKQLYDFLKLDNVLREL